MMKRAKQYIAIFRPKKRRVRVAKAAITKLCIYNEDGGLQRIADAALAAIEALPAAPKGGA